ncbi:MAG: hypothetical protein ACOX43_05390 [Bacilli bacterium]|jgi:hypothetical protein
MLLLNLKESLNIAWQGILAVFIGIGIIYLTILILISFQKKKK